MSEERLQFIRSLDSLAPLSEHTDVIDVAQNGRVEINNRLLSPTDEFGIPRPEIMVERLLGVMATQNYVWTGKYDEHHLATPKADFSIVRTEMEGDIGSAFRGLSCLKIDLPRQMHNFSHAIFELPGRPSVDVMRQAVTEIGNAKQIQLIINQYFPEARQDYSDRESKLGMYAISDALGGMLDSEVNMIPTLNELSSMSLVELRKVVNTALRVRCFSDKNLIHPAIRTVGTYRKRITRFSNNAA
jgi:hypothetical protein